MTICIAGICGEDRVVLASDRMITESGTLRVEFEPDRPKMIGLTDSVIALSAGNALRPSDITQEIDDDNLAGLADGIAEEVKEAVSSVTQRVLEDNHLSKYGLDFPTFFSQLGNSGLAGQLYREIKEHEESGVLGITLLIAGADEQGPHIFVVRDPAEKACFDDIGFHAIGSGTDHARGSLIFNEFHKRSLSLGEGAYLLHEAKKAAEIAPGVGKEYTDMWIVSENEYEKLDDEILDEFNRITKLKSKKNETALADAFEDVKDVNL